MKIKGNELLLWMNDGWPEGDWCWDHELFDDEPDPDTTYDTDELGGLFWQGIGDDPTNGEGLDIAKLIRRWRKERSFDVLTIEVPKDKTEAAKAALKQMGVKV